MKKGQQQEPLQDQIERLEDEINDAIHAVEENSLDLARMCCTGASPRPPCAIDPWDALNPGDCTVLRIVARPG